MGRRQARERIELIEVLDPTSSFMPSGHAGGGDLFPRPGSGVGSGFGAGPPGPVGGRRWARVAVPLALAVVVAVSAALAWGGNDPAPPPKAAAPIAPTTTGPATTAQVTALAPATAPQIAVPSQHPEARLLGTAPAGVTLRSVTEIRDDDNDNDFDHQVSAALWSDDAHAEPGVRWLQVATTPDAFGITPGPGQMRVARSGGVVTIRSAPTGLTLSGHIDGGTATIQSSGIGVADLVTVLDGLRRSDDGVRLDPAALPAGFALRSSTARSERVWTPTYTYSLFSGPSTAIGTSLNATPWLEVEIGPPPNGFAAAVAEFFLVDGTDIAVAGVEGRIGTDERAGFRLRRLTFGRNGLTVTLTSWGVSDDALVAHANSIRLYSAPGWTRLEKDLPGLDNQPIDAATDERPFPMAAGNLPGSVDGKWSIDYHTLTDLPHRLGLAVSITPDHYRQMFDVDSVLRDRPSFAATATADQTFVVAVVPDGTDAAALRVTVAGAVVETVAFADVDGLDNRAAVSVFSELGPYIAQIVAADGSVLAEYDPTVIPAVDAP